MSIHSVPAGPGPAIVAQLKTAVRAPTSIAQDQVNWTLTYTPDLTAAEVTILNRLVTASKSAVSITSAEWQAIEADVTTAKAYIAIATPTLVQTAAASKAIIRILAALLRS